jgi:hypothetical protein
MLRLIQPADFPRSPCLGLRRRQTTPWHPQPGWCNRPSRQPRYGQTRPCRPRRELNEIITFGRIKTLHRPHHHVRLSINNCVGVQPSSTSSSPGKETGSSCKDEESEEESQPAGCDGGRRLYWFPNAGRPHRPGYQPRRAGQETGHLVSAGAEIRKGHKPDQRGASVQDLRSFETSAGKYVRARSDCITMVLESSVSEK